jgi:hypothetical protein
MLLYGAITLLCGALAAEPIDVTLDVDWGDFLGRHDLEWDWTWGTGGGILLQPIASDLSHCGVGGSPGQCCIVAAVGGQVQLAECAFQNASHQWLICKS